MPLYQRTRLLSTLSSRQFKTLVFALTFFFSLLATQCLAITLKVGWQPSPDSRVTGYKLFYGQSSGNYSKVVDAGGESSCTLSDIRRGWTYYFAAAAYDAKGNQSDYSEEISYTVPILGDNSAPVAGSATLNLKEDGEATATLQASDPDGDGLTFSIVSGPTLGVVTLIDAFSGSFRYVPFPNAFGTDSFTFKASDSQTDSNIATITLNIAAVNDPPVAVEDMAVTNQRTPIIIDVLANDSDPDGDPLTVKSVKRGRNGRVRIIGKTTIQYTPRRRFNGTDTFTYRAGDGRLKSAPTTVTVQVLDTNTPPNAIHSAYSSQGGVAVAAAMNAVDPDGDPLEYLVTRQPSKGTLSLTNPATGAFVYTPHAGSSGEDSFRFKVNDGRLDSNVASVSIDLGASNPVVFAVNAGGPEYVDCRGIHYQADSHYSGGRAARSAAHISETEDDVLYQSERRGEFSYDIPVGNGHYLVTLKLAETHWKAPERRLMDVTFEGREILSDLDLYAAAGGNRAYDIRLPVQVSDGALNIGFKADLDQAKLSALLVERLESGMSYGVNAGGRLFVDTAGFVYEHDAFGSGGQTQSSPALPERTDDADLLAGWRSGDFTYDIPLPDGVYLVTLKIGGLSIDGESGHPFHVRVQDQEVLSSFDTGSIVGDGAPCEVPFLAAVQDGHLRLSFESQADRVRLSAIRIESQE